MAEFQRMPTQEELQKILYMGQMQGKTTQEIINENLAKGSTIKALPESFFTTASAGAKRAGDYINRAGTAADVAKLFPGYQPETKVTIPTSFSVVPKVDPYSGQVMPTGIQTQQAPIGNVLQQIKPADVLGVSGAERAYGDIGAGKAPQPMDVVDTLGLGASGMAAGKGLLTAGAKTANYAAPVVGEALQNYASRTGLLMPLNTYHGSRYPFTEFDLSKAGTGEGSQIQGYGVYLAEAPGTARQYAAIAYKPGLQQGSSFASDISRLDAVIKLNASNFTGGDVSKLADVIKRAPTAFKNPDAMLERIATYTNNNPTGYLYTVDLPDKYIPKMLDYDEPIKNQHKVVRDFAKKQGLSMDDTGFDLLQKVGRDKAGADLMQSAGIPGVKYADQMRLGEEGNRPRNFVVFNPKNIKIIEQKKVNE